MLQAVLLLEALNKMPNGAHVSSQCVEVCKKRRREGARRRTD